MQAEYDSEADAIAIVLVPGGRAEFGQEVHPRGIVAVAGDEAIQVEILFASNGVEEPLAAAAERYGLDREALEAAARSAVAAPDRHVVLDVKGPA